MLVCKPMAVVCKPTVRHVGLQTNAKCLQTKVSFQIIGNIDVDRALALEWLIRSAEFGHRGARSRVMAVLEKRVGEDYGGFTDASRQTILSDDECNHRNPAELIRRQTIVGKSRKES